MAAIPQCTNPGSSRLKESDTSLPFTPAASTPSQEISQGLETMVMGGREVNVRAYIAAFNLKGAMQEKPVGALSGGERGRVHLAKVRGDGYARQLRGGHLEVTRR